MSLATWLTSGWVDFALITGWMALVWAIGWRAWRRSGGDE